jgi:hypothetical protein
VKISRKLALLFVMILPVSGRAEFSFNSNCREAYNLIIQLRFEEGRKIINEEKRLRPTNGIPYLLENYIDYFGTFISEREDMLKKWGKELDNRIDKVKENDKQSPYYLFSQAQIYLQHAFVRFKFREYAMGAYEIHKAYKMLERNNQQFPDFKANLMGLGVIHSLIGTVPEDYKWLVSLVGMRGTIQQGVKELNLLVSTCRNSEYEFLYPEASVLLALLQMYLQKDYESALRVMTNVDKVIPEFNPIVCFVQASILLHTGKSDLAIQKVQERFRDPGYFPIAYLDYLEGIARLNKLDKDAHTYFLRYISDFKGTSFVKAAYQKLAWYYLIQGNTDKYHEYMNICKTAGQALIDEDKQALNEAVSGEMPNILLLRARLYFDGGYYLKALGEIAGNPGDKFPR